MLSKILLLFSGNVATSLINLIRNLLIASLIPVEDYGIAATFALAITVIEMMTALGMQQQIIQARDGDNERLQAGLQGFAMVRGLISGAILFFSAGWIAAYLGIPEVAWAYQLLALVPILSGLQHFDIHRLQRQMAFWPLILSQFVPAFVALLLVWPVFLIFGDFRVMLSLILLNCVIALVLSHVLAKRAWAVTFDTQMIVRAVQFGWPLLINNILLFFVFNGEKIVVARVLGMEDLAVLALGITLTLTPTLVIARTTRGFFLPQLSKAQDDPAAFEKLAYATMQIALLNGAFVMVAIVVVGPPFVRLALGEDYAPLVTLIIWLAVLNGMRAFKTGAAVVALARAQTTNAMIANGFRLLALPFAAWAAVSGADLLTIVIIAIIGEACGVVVAFLLVFFRLKLPMRPMVPSLLACAGVFALTLITALHGQDWADVLHPLPFWGLASGCVVLFLALVGASQSVWAYLRSLRNKTDLQKPEPARELDHD